MRRPRVHVIGAGLAGLAAAVSLAQAGREVHLHEAALQAGGRCRSYFDPALGLDIDNGNHLVLSGNKQAMAYAGMIGSSGKLEGPAEATFDFVDLRDGARWQLRPGAGRMPWWIFVAGRRVPGTRARDYFALARLLMARKGATVGEAMACSGRLYETLWQPLLAAALNTDPPEASAALAAAVIRETLARGGRACRPLTAPGGLSGAFVDPALSFLKALGNGIKFGRRLRGFEFTDGQVAALDFGPEREELSTIDCAVLAVPAHVAVTLVPGLQAPAETRAIVNGHFAVAPPPALPRITGVVGGMAEWIFAWPGRISTTTSAAGRLLDMPREQLAAALWRDVSAACGIDPSLPPWQIVKERRATFAATPAQDALRPPGGTRWRNLALAGDFTRTGLPATIEGAIGSGFKAAANVLRSRAAAS